MPHKHLKDLLMEDQEPFHLKNYIADRRFMIKPKPNLNQIHSNSSSKFNLCRHACFLSFKDSPDVRKSPFPSPIKSPCRSPIFLQIPSRTAAMLLEAAARIQQRNNSVKSKPSSAVGLLGSFLKKFKYKNRIKMVPESSPEDKTTVEFSCSCRHSSGSTSTSSSPSSPFRFSLQKPPSSGRNTPEFPSPASSPVHCNKKEGDGNSYDDSEKVEEEEKEQCSPVSVLDPPFEDDEIEHYEEDDEEDGTDDYDLECSFAIVQKVKEQLLQKLRRFERLAELDPVELEKRMSEDQDDDEEEDMTNVTETFSDDDEEENEEEDMDIVKAVYGKTCSNYTNNLVLDLVYEEKKNGALKDENVVSRVCKRLDSWKEVESNTIDMMVEVDFSREVDGWKRCDQEQMRETVMEIELGIFRVLIDELSEELGFP